MFLIKEILSFFFGSPQSQSVSITRVLKTHRDTEGEFLLLSKNVSQELLLSKKNFFILSSVQKKNKIALFSSPLWYARAAETRFCVHALLSLFASREAFAVVSEERQSVSV